MNIDRRETLKLMVGGALAMAAIPIVSACDGPERAAEPARDDELAGIDPVIADILQHAALAPSGHNAQPWTVRVPSTDRLLIGTARDRWLPAVDPHNRELVLSLGCFLENLAVAAQFHGRDIAYRINEDVQSNGELLDVTLPRATPVPHDLRRLRLRRTVRSHHLSRSIESADLRAITAPLADRMAFFPAGSGQANWLAAQTIEANRAQADRDAAQLELSHWIRWADADARRERNGLTPASMEISGISGWYVRHFMRAPSVMQPSFRERGVDAVRKQVKSCGGWLVVSSPDASVSTLVETGRRVERMWLACRERMIAIHPMTQVLEEAPFRDEVARALGITGQVQFILRVSYLAQYPDPVSLRMPLSRFVRAG